MKMFFILCNIRRLEIKINLTCLSEKLISLSFKLEKCFYSCNYKHQMTFMYLLTFFSEDGLKKGSLRSKLPQLNQYDILKS